MTKAGESRTHQRAGAILPAFVFVTDVTKTPCNASLRGILAFFEEKFGSVKLFVITMRCFFRLIRTK